jgi:hypothetical protein
MTTPHEEIGFVGATHEGRSTVAPRHSWYLIAEAAGVMRHRCGTCGALRTTTVQADWPPQTKYLVLGKVYDRAPPCSSRSCQ